VRQLGDIRLAAPHRGEAAWPSKTPNRPDFYCTARRRLTNPVTSLNLRRPNFIASALSCITMILSKMRRPLYLPPSTSPRQHHRVALAALERTDLGVI